jgi:DNA-nicking Smr family endonuclease
VSVRKPPPKSEPERAGVWSELSEEERRLFEKEFADVAPLCARGATGSCWMPATRSRRCRCRREAHIPRRRAGCRASGRDHHGRKPWRFSRDLAGARSRRHSRGSTCDLHGLGAEAARRSIQQFVRDSAIAGRRRCWSSAVAGCTRAAKAPCFAMLP